MELTRSRVVLTGATGGLGAALARALSAAGAALLLTGRNATRLDALQGLDGLRADLLTADLATTAGVAAVAAATQEFGANVLINNAGMGAFGLLQTQPVEEIERLLITDLIAPVLLTKAMLPGLLAQPEAAVVNVGSALGRIPFAGFTTYSAAKAGLYGFSQALRRELADTAVRVVHVSPRSVDTALNSAAVVELNRLLGNASAPPERVAARILEMLRRDTAEALIGAPERFFARLNAVLPAVVDRGLRGKLALIKRCAASQHNP